MGALGAAFFDIDDTLYPTHQFAWEGRRRAVEAMIQAGLRADPDELMERLRWIIDERGSNDPHHFDELLSELPEDACGHVNPAIIVAQAVVTYHAHKSRELYPYEDAVTFLKRLRAKEVTLGVITSGVPVKQAEKLVRLGLVEFFQPGLIFIAGQMGFDGKPPEMYRQVLEKAGLEAGQALYVGDHPVNDVDAANAAGFLTAHMDRAGHYSGLEGKSEPRFEVNNFLQLMDELTPLLEA